MKTSELFEQLQRRKSPEEKEALRNAPDYWRKELRKEFTKFNQQFGIYLAKSEKFNPYNHHVAELGGDYEFLVSGSSLTLPKEKRFELWKKAYAQKLIELAKKGYTVKLYVTFAKPIKPDDTVEKVVKEMEREMRPRHLGNPEKSPLIVSYRVYIHKPEKKHDEDIPAS